MDQSSDSQPGNVTSSLRYQNPDEIIYPQCNSEPEDASLPTCEVKSEETDSSPVTEGHVELTVVLDPDVDGSSNSQPRDSISSSREQNPDEMMTTV